MLPGLSGPMSIRNLTTFKCYSKRKRDKERETFLGSNGASSYALGLNPLPSHAYVYEDTCPRVRKHKPCVQDDAYARAQLTFAPHVHLAKRQVCHPNSKPATRMKLLHSRLIHLFWLGGEGVWEGIFKQQIYDTALTLSETPFHCTTQEQYQSPLRHVLT